MLSSGLWSRNCQCTLLLTPDIILLLCRNIVSAFTLAELLYHVLSRDLQIQCNFNSLHFLIFFVSEVKTP